MPGSGPSALAPRVIRARPADTALRRSFLRNGFPTNASWKRAQTALCCTLGDGPRGFVGKRFAAERRGQPRDFEPRSGSAACGSLDAHLGVDRPRLGGHVGPCPAWAARTRHRGVGDAVGTRRHPPRSRSTATARCSAIARFDQEAGRADHLGECPDRRRDDRRARTRSTRRAARPAASEMTGRIDGSGTPRTRAAGTAGPRPGRRRAARRRPGRRLRARAPPGRRASPRRRGPAAATKCRRQAGRSAGTGERWRGRRTGSDVMAGVVAAGIDEIAVPCARVLTSALAPRRPRRARRPPRVAGDPSDGGTRGRPRRQGHDPDPVTPDVEQTAGAAGRRLGPDDHRRRLTDQLRAQPLPEPARRSTAGTSPGNSHGARSRSVTTTGSRDAIGSGPPPTA